MNKKNNTIIIFSSAGGPIGVASLIIYGWPSAVMGTPTTTTPTTPATPTTMLVSFATFDLSLEDMAFDSELIVKGKVVDQKQGRTIPPPAKGMLPLPTTNTLVQVQKVLKGQDQEKKTPV